MDIDICISAPHSAALQNQWDYVLSHWGFNDLYVIGQQSHECNSHIFKNSINIKNADELPQKKLIVLAPKMGMYIQGNKSLVDFNHPLDSIYFFGPDNLHLSEDQLGTRKPDELVYIPTDTSHEMYSFVAASITFYDRILKEVNG